MCLKRKGNPEEDRYEDQGRCQSPKDPGESDLACDYAIDHPDPKVVEPQFNHILALDFSSFPQPEKPLVWNLSFLGVDSESLMSALRNLAVSSGSACTSASIEPSYVLRAIGLDDATAHASLRFGLGRFTTAEEVDFAIDEVVREVTRLRGMASGIPAKQEKAGATPAE